MEEKESIRGLEGKQEFCFEEVKEKDHCKGREKRK
jgi:hypothetical protein